MIVLAVCPTFRTWKDVPESCRKSLFLLAHKRLVQHGKTQQFVKWTVWSRLAVPGGGGGGAQTPRSAGLRYTGLQSSIPGRRYKLGCTCRFSCSVCWPGCLYLRHTATVCDSNSVQTHFDRTLISFKRHSTAPLLTQGVAAAIVMLRTVPDLVAVASHGPPAGEAPQAPGCTATAARNAYEGEQRRLKEVSIVIPSYLQGAANTPTPPEHTASFWWLLLLAERTGLCEEPQFSLLSGQIHRLNSEVSFIASV